MLTALEAEADAWELIAAIEYPGQLEIRDTLNRFIVVGQPDGPAYGWRVDVWPSVDAFMNGAQPAAFETLTAALHGVPDPKLMIAAALQIAGRVPVTGIPARWPDDADPTYIINVYVKPGALALTQPWLHYLIGRALPYNLWHHLSASSNAAGEPTAAGAPDESIVVQFIPND